MRYHTAIFTLVLLLMPVLGYAQKAASTPQDGTIRLGQPMAEVAKILTEHKIRFHEGGFALIAKKDSSNLYVPLDDEHTCACVFLLDIEKDRNRYLARVQAEQDVGEKYTCMDASHEPDTARRPQLLGPLRTAAYQKAAR